MIGELDQRVTFQRKTRVADSQGGYAETWADFVTVWARVRGSGGREAVVADTIEASAKYAFTIRNRTDMTEADRIKWHGETYNIRTIRRAGRAQYMTIDAEFGVAS